MPELKKITVRNFKSIRTLDEFELHSLNLLIGANGAGKSNFISLFDMLAAMTAKRLQLFVAEHDGPDALLFGTRKRSEEMALEFYFARNGYRLTLRPTGERFVFAREETWFGGDFLDSSHALGSGHEEARLADVENDTFTPYVRPALADWRVYHFHDTSISARVRQASAVRDNLRLKPDAGNLAPFLRHLYEGYPEHYLRIIETVRKAAPFFGDFVYRRDVGEQVELEWYSMDDPDTVRGPRQLSDGTLRFICLATLLMQPSPLQPSTILIDEPELGLHPYALSLIGALLRQASNSRQIIVSTQSADLVSEFDPEDVVVVQNREGASVFERLQSERLAAWLDDYSLGELWRMNILGGRPE